MTLFWTFKSLAPCSREIITPAPQYSMFTGWMLLLFLTPNQQCQNVQQIYTKSATSRTWNVGQYKSSYTLLYYTLPSEKQTAIKQRKEVIPIVVLLCSTLGPMMIRLHATTCLAVNEICTNVRISNGLLTMEHMYRRLRLHNSSRRFTRMCSRKWDNLPLKLVAACSAM